MPDRPVGFFREGGKKKPRHEKKGIAEKDLAKVKNIGEKIEVKVDPVKNAKTRLPTEEELSVLDKVDRDVEKYGQVIIARLIANSNLSETGKKNIKSTLDDGLYQVSLEISNSFGPEFEGITKKDRVYDSLETVKKRDLEHSQYINEEDFGMDESGSKPKDEAERIANKLFEPFERARDEQIASNPRRTQDYVEGKKIIDEFYNEVFSHMRKQIREYTKM